MRHQERVRHIRGVTNRERMVAGVLLAATVALVVALVSGGSEDAPDPELQTPVAAPAPDASDGPDRDPGHRGADRRPDPDPDPKADELPEGPSGPAPSSGPERQAAGTLREYIRALNRGDGERLCAVFEPGALDGFDFPRARGSCAASVAASLGYRDPRGLPVWERSEVTDAIAVEISGTEARVVAKNSLVPMGLSLLNKAIDFAFAMLYVRLLGPEGTGKWYFVVALYGFFGIISRYGLGTLLTRDVAEDKNRSSRYLTNVIALRTFLWLGVLPVLVAVTWFYRNLGTLEINVLGLHLFG